MMAKSIAKNTSYLYAKVLINIFISLYTTRLILNSLGTVDFGLWGVIGGAIAFLSFLNPALSTATQRFMSFHEGKGDKQIQQKFFSVSIIMHLIATVIIIVLLESCYYPLFHYILNIPPDRLIAAQFVFHCMVLSISFTFISVPYDATINAHEDMKYYAFIGIFESLLKLIAALLLSIDLIVHKLEVYGICQVLITIIILLIMRRYCSRNYREARFSYSVIDRKTLREMSIFAGWNLTGTFSNIIGNYGGGIVTNHFFGASINAVLSITGQLGGYLNTFSVNMLKAVNPVIVKSAGSGDNCSMINYTMLSCKIAFLLFSLFAIPVLIETPLILKVWLKNVPDWTVLFVRIYFIRVFFEQITVSLKTAINANGKIASFNKWTAFSQLLSLPIMIIAFMNGLLPYWELIIAMLFMAIIPGFIQLYYAQKLCGLHLMRFFSKVIIRAIPCTVVSLCLCITTKHFISFSEYGDFFLTLIIHLISFIVMVYFWGLDLTERKYINSTLESIKKRVLKIRSNPY